MYYRFESRDGWGLFQQAFTFECRADAKMLTSRVEKEFREHIQWLRSQTPVPPKSAYVDTRSRFPKTWYKPEAKEHIRRAWLLADIMSRNGLRVRPRWSREPGIILFEDDVQVVVRPNRENTRIPPKPRRPRRWNGDRSTIRRWEW